MLAPAALEAGIGTAGLRFVDVPPSHTSVPAAEAAYRRGMRELAGGSWGTAEDLFLEAEAADPDFASAHLQLALAASGTCPPDLKLARHAFAEAQRTRDRLAARDQEVLAAIAPAILDPPNLAEEAARFQALAVRRPLDAQVWDMLGNAENKLFHFDASARAVAIEARVDQTQTDGYLVWAQDTESRPEAERIIDECLRHDDVAPGCRVERMELQSTSGSCQAMEDEARTLAALSPASYVGPSMLARALADEGASLCSV
jgi:tetratricopeptide (TPR) repeat protein